MFTVNGEEWFIVLVPPEHRELYNPIMNEYTIGSCNDDTKTIYINNMLDDYMLYKVLCHEITHAAMFSYDVALTRDQEELLADLIATYGKEIFIITDNVFARLKGRSY